MSTDVQRAVQFANPVTGDVLTLASPAEDLAGYLADLREFESVIREHKAMVNRELLSRMDRARSWTLHAGSHKLSAPSDEPDEQWDGESLYEALTELVDEGVITIDAVNAAVEAVTEWKVKKAGVKALRKNPRIAELIAPFCEQVEKKRYVSVSRDG